MWEEWKSPAGERIKSCTVITTEPNELIEPLHDRMPVILAEEDWPLWLGEVPAAEAELTALLRLCPTPVIDSIVGVPAGAGCNAYSGHPTTGYRNQTEKVERTFRLVFDSVSTSSS